MAEPDLTEFEAHMPNRGPRCGVGIALKDLKRKPAQLAKLQAALAHERITGSAIAHTLKDWGIDCSPLTVQRHRRKECRCDR